jgi:hypothetical protein
MKQSIRVNTESVVNGQPTKFRDNAVLIFGVSLNDERVLQLSATHTTMFTSLLAEALAVTADNLNMTATIMACTEAAAEELLSDEAKQRLHLVHLGLAMALQAMEHDELQHIMAQSEAYMPLDIAI